MVSADILNAESSQKTRSNRAAHQGSVVLGIVVKFNGLLQHDDEILTQKHELLEQYMKMGGTSLVKEKKKESDVNNNNNNENNNKKKKSNSNNGGNNRNKSMKHDCSNEKIDKKNV